MVPVGYANPLTGIQVPIVLGHDVAGTVVHARSGVDDLELGELVAIEPIVACRKCGRCQDGAYDHCSQMALRIPTRTGILAEYTVAALVEPLAVS